MTWPVRHLSQSVAASPEDVAAFAGDPARLPLWAAGVSAGIRHDNGRWLTRSPMGEVEVRFIGPVDRGILDHEVVMPDGTVVFNALRVLANDGGSEVVFSLFQRPGMDAADFEADARLVRQDLARLREVVEGSPAPGE
ncbi:SRPBCC family protein [Microbacterium sp. LRZ72]|uniref:SRPBCC family protein n=1 Tax=Microbacterium sp. LRZ72 TaxID=2942481 RepID=UPI0029B88B07|nr:SRPBCC family protein [Microbacterium sp. LRZ72]MDX2377339.1 SRPBCC family protein [Microbacterium sp. LRZ72]